MAQIGAKAQRVYEYILDCMSEGMPPTVREICKDLGFKSTSTAHKYLVELEKAGHIVRESGLNRNIKINSDKILQVPLLGTVAAGTPILAIQNIESYIPFAARGYSNGDLFALNVKGSSMIEIGMLPNDIIIVEQTNVANEGEIVVAMIDEEATVKRFYRDKEGFVLKAENVDFPNIYCDKVEILGKVVASLRNYD